MGDNLPRNNARSQFDPNAARSREITVPPRHVSPLNVADNIRDLTERLNKAEKERDGALSLDRQTRWAEAAAYLEAELKSAVAHRDAQKTIAETAGVTYAPALSDDASPGMQLPADPDWRNNTPMADGLLYYFPNALAEVSRVSKVGNDQHNAGEPMHWARGKSTDHANKILKHLIDAGKFDTDGTRHTAKLAWRALALLQEEMERDTGAPPPRNAR